MAKRQIFAVLILYSQLCSVNSNILYANDFEISNGYEVNLSEKGFSISPPVGWEYSLNYPGLSLLAQKPKSKKELYQATVQIMTFQGSKYIDEQSAVEFEQILVKKFTNASRSVRNYAMRNFVMTEMADGRPGILFYSEFELLDKKMMQAHILVSSDRFHYLMTYTDLAKNFEDQTGSQNLNFAWSMMTSILLEGAPAPIRGQRASNLLLLVVLILTSLVTFSLWRRKREKKSLQNIDEFTSSMSGVSELNARGSAPDSSVINLGSDSGSLETSSNLKSRDNSSDLESGALVKNISEVNSSLESEPASSAWDSGKSSTSEGSDLDDSKIAESDFDSKKWKL